MKYLLITLALGLYVFQIKAQSIERQVISSYGLLTPNTSITVGEVVIETKTISGSFTINQGFQQSEDKTETSIVNRTFTLNYTLFPNPSSEYITINITADKSIKTQIYIVNSIGQQVSEIINAHINDNYQNTWNTNNLAAGNYFLIIKDEKSKQKESISFVKM